MAGELADRRIQGNKSPYYSNSVGDASFTVGAEVGNVMTVAVQLKKRQGGRDIGVRAKVDWYIAGDANGDTIVATAPDGGVAAGTDGAVVSTVTGKAGFAISEADGDIDIAITHAAGAKTVYLAIVLPDGTLKMSGAITFA